MLSNPAERGLFRAGSACVVRLSNIPEGLSEVELKTLVPEYGHKIVTLSR
jgi:hypothetical protein